MTDQPPPPPPPSPSGPSPPAGGACPVCGRQGTLRSMQKELTTKKRPKFGIFWVLVTICTVGLGFLLWLVWPRHKEVVGVDRYLECSACNARV